MKPFYQNSVFLAKCDGRGHECISEFNRGAVVSSAIPYTLSASKRPMFHDSDAFIIAPERNQVGDVRSICPGVYDDCIPA
jgi:hypothetical protein